MIHPSLIQPDAELRDFLQGNVVVGLPGGTTAPVKVYRDWERPTNELPDDFIVVYMNGDIGGVGLDTPYASGYVIVSLFCKMNDDGSIKINRIQNIMSQFDTLIEGAITDHYHFKYDADRYITPTSPNQTSGYSITSLNLRWTTTSNINS